MSAGVSPAGFSSAGAATAAAFAVRLALAKADFALERRTRSSMALMGSISPASPFSTNSAINFS